MSEQHRWVIVLDSPSNLASADRFQCSEEYFYAPIDWGVSVPPRLQPALRHARKFALSERIFVVSTQWNYSAEGPEITEGPSFNVLLLPSSMGSASALLLPLLEIKRRDPQAKVLVLPGNYQVENEALFLSLLEDSMDALGSEFQRVSVMNLPDELAVLMAPINSFLLLYMIAEPQLLKPVLTAFREKGGLPDRETLKIIHALPSSDFQTDILQVTKPYLKMLPDLPCPHYPTRMKEHQAPPRRMYH